ncbi:MAG: hypothetical protein ACJ74M_08325 [Gaiellaceae bacterium]|jgi:hypothetical protein
MRVKLFLLAAALTVLALPAQTQAGPAPIRSAGWSSLATAYRPLALSERDAATSNPATFTDAQNDSGTAPDVRTVIVSNDSGLSRYTFRINVAHLTLPSNVVVLIFIDSDQNAATGSSGADYVLVCDESDGSVGLLHWDGTQFALVPAPTLSASDDSTSVTASIGKSDIGNGTGLNLSVLTVEGTTIAAGHFDVAPDQGEYNYQLSAAAALTLAASSLHAPRTVKAGKTFTVTMLAARSDTGEFVNDEIGGTTSCLATVGRKRVTLLGAGFVESTSPELAVCLFRAPKVHRRVIRGTISVAVEGVSVKKAFAVTVK